MASIYYLRSPAWLSCVLGLAYHKAMVKVVMAGLLWGGPEKIPLSGSFRVLAEFSFLCWGSLFLVFCQPGVTLSFLEFIPCQHGPSTFKASSVVSNPSPVCDLSDVLLCC